MEETPENRGLKMKQLAAQAAFLAQWQAIDVMLTSMETEVDVDWLLVLEAQIGERLWN